MVSVYHLICQILFHRLYVHLYELKTRPVCNAMICAGSFCSKMQENVIVEMCQILLFVMILEHTIKQNLTKVFTVFKTENCRYKR